MRQTLCASRPRPAWRWPTSPGPAALAHSVTSAFVQGMDAALWTSAVALVGALVAWRLMPSYARRPEAVVRR